VRRAACAVAPCGVRRSGLISIDCGSVVGTGLQGHGVDHTWCAVLNVVWLVLSGVAGPGYVLARIVMLYRS
jgi:hypothetical protein